ncbi:aminoglycoside phosphotransferase family protein [Paenibacillus sp. P25]|nr:aminoglycoside phosphotransferase family protein [Paenibacillus sp. P25]
MMKDIGGEPRLRKLAVQLAGFLKKLHGIPVEDVLPGGRNDNGSLQWLDLYERIRTKLYPCMKQEAKEWTDRHFTGFLGDSAKAKFTPSLIHGDFGTLNILYDTAEGRISGIIDFGSAEIGDPAVDYAALLASYGEGFFRFVTDENPEVNRYLARISFYRGTFALQEALFGLENNDEEAFRNGMEGFR